MTNTYSVNSLSNYVLPYELNEKINTIMISSKKNNTIPGHILLHGPAGTGKTTLARVIANEFHIPLITFEGVTLNSLDKLKILIPITEPGAVLFIDEIHSTNKKILEAIYSIMEDNSMLLDSTTKFLLAPICVIGATTELSKIEKPLIDRFVYKLNFPVYSIPELVKIAYKMATVFNLDITPKAYNTLAVVARGVPRVLRTFIQDLKNYSIVNNIPQITESILCEYLSKNKIDPLTGLNEVDLKILKVLETGPKSPSTIAAKAGIDEDTYRKNHEVFLIGNDFVDISPRGRVLATKGSAMLNGYVRSASILYTGTHTPEYKMSEEDNRLIEKIFFVCDTTVNPPGMIMTYIQSDAFKTEDAGRLISILLKFKDSLRDPDHEKVTKLKIYFSEYISLLIQAAIPIVMPRIVINNRKEITRFFVNRSAFKKEILQEIYSWITTGLFDFDNTFKTNTNIDRKELAEYLKSLRKSIAKELGI